MMNFGTFMVLAVLVLAVGLIFHSMYRDKKAGKSVICGCGCGCSSCKGHCHLLGQETKEGK